jgi:hypothetical protein
MQEIGLGLQCSATVIELRKELEELKKEKSDAQHK